VREPKTNPCSSNPDGQIARSDAWMDFPLTDRMTLREASDYLHIPQNTLRWWRTCDSGPRSYALGGKVFYDKADIDAWIAVEQAASVRGGE
jgi:predicted DNA-binding transcriptional regulator AlpA